MLSPTANAEAPASRPATAAQRLLLTAGAVAPVLLIAVAIADGATRIGYDPWRHQVSHLALGERGWLGVANLVVCGALLIAFAFGPRRTLTPGRGARWATTLVLLAGAGFAVGGIFRIDPGLGYPPGEPDSHSVSGTVHDAAGAVVFASLTAAAILLGRCLGGNYKWLGYLAATIVVTSFIAASVLLTLDFAGTLPGAPSGLLERVALFTGVGWLGVVAARLLGRLAR